MDASGFAICIHYEGIIKPSTHFRLLLILKQKRRCVMPLAQWKGKNMTELRIGLCAARHEMPVNTFLFDTEVNPLDVNGLAARAEERLHTLAEEVGVTVTEKVCKTLNTSNDDVYRRCYDARLVIYVTGLSVALVAAINAALPLFAEVVLMHYDRESGQYYEQEVRGL